MTLEPSQAEFPATQWTLIDALSRPGHPGHADALEQLIRRYWPPIYGYLRSTGKRHDEAEELAQAFFSEKILGGQLFLRADASRGKLRSMLLTALKNFLVDEHRKRRPAPAVSLSHLARSDVREPILKDDEGRTPEEVYDRRWALSLVSEAVRRLEKFYQSPEKQKQWRAFDLWVLRPASGLAPPPTAAVLAKETGFSSGDELIECVRAVRKRFKTHLRQLIAETTPDPAEQDAELRHLLALLT